MTVECGGHAAALPTQEAAAEAPKIPRPAPPVSFRAAKTARNPLPTERRWPRPAIGFPVILSAAKDLKIGNSRSVAVGACPERAKRVEWAAQSVGGEDH
jgi:hypothetical protein